MSPIKLDWLLTGSNSREHNIELTSWRSTYGAWFFWISMWFSRVRLKKYKLKKYPYKKKGKKNEFQFGAVVLSSFRTCLCELAAISTSPIINLVCPPRFCITFVFHFSRVLQSFQYKLERLLMQKLGGTNKVHYRRCANGELVILIWDRQRLCLWLPLAHLPSLYWLNKLWALSMFSP